MELIGGRWELRDPIASGGSATVWRAYDHKLGRECAAKVLRHRDAGHIIRFAREQSLRLEGPHVVAPYAWVADDGTALIASELVTGGSLAGLIGDYGALSDGTVVAIVDQLLDALDDIHEAGVVHRDVKPGNVLLRATGAGPIDVALTDFGIAIATTDARLTTAGMVIGTPGYVPPEVMRGHSGPEMSHDLYALGWLAMVLILGREGGTSDEALARVSDSILAAAIEQMTAPEAEARPRTVAAVRALLAGAARDDVPRDREGEPIEVFEQLPGEGSEAAGVMDRQTGAASETGMGTLARVETVRDEQVASGGQAASDESTIAAHLSVRAVEEGAVPPPVQTPLTATDGMPTVPSPHLSATQHASPAGTDPKVAAQLPFPQFAIERAVEPSHAASPNWILRAIIGVVSLGVGIAIAVAIWSNVGDPGGPSSPDPLQSTVSVPSLIRPEVGEACSWQMEGDQATSPEGTAVACELGDGGYSWQPR